MLKKVSTFLMCVTETNPQLKHIKRLYHWQYFYKVLCLDTLYTFIYHRDDENVSEHENKIQYLTIYFILYTIIRKNAKIKVKFGCHYERSQNTTHLTTVYENFKAIPAFQRC